MGAAEIQTDIITDITANQPVSGQDVKNNTGHKRHKVKKIIVRLEGAGTIERTTPGNGRWYSATWSIV